MYVAEVQNQKIGIRMRALRLIHGFTQKKVASFLGLERSAYTHYESGKALPTIESFIKLSMLYRTSVDYLICITNNPRRYPR